MTLFETPRLTVRRFRPEDLEALAAILADPQVMRWLEPPFDREKTAAFLSAQALLPQPRVWAICAKGGALLGHLIYHPYENHRWELGWVLRREAWGRHFATELTEAAIAHARANGVQALIIECAPGQRASRRVAEKCGFIPIPSEDICVFERTIP